MHATPLRLQQAIRTAFRASRPIRRPALERIPPIFPSPVQQSLRQSWKGERCFARQYSDDKKTTIEEKIKDAHNRVDDAIESRADAVASPPKELKRDETIVHTHPESSSIVHRADEEKFSQIKDGTNISRLPSESKSKQSETRKRFSHYMDNFQSHIFVASRRLNELTGYTGIETLKKDIEVQEDLVHEARKHVKDTRQKYSDAIENRSTTQREVNDLLHRKHAWSPEDLQRFTDLYRSDHANEQAEQKAHEELSQAESQYEEASTKLAKSILARYHEEQIWSDKIRQMSTWGTWGLMGLNVLLFIVFQILVEPWRRKRLVKGFEEKVQEALKENNSDVVVGASKISNANELVQQAVEDQPREGIVVLAGEKIGEAVADALGGANSPVRDGVEVPTKESIEQAAEHTVSQELSQEENAATVMAVAQTVEEGGIPSAPPFVDESAATSKWQDVASNAFGQATSGYAEYQNRFQAYFNDTQMVIISRRDLTATMLEGVVVGAGIMATLLWAVGKG